MNGDQLTPVVRRWLRHTEATPPDARQSARQVMARMPYVRQRSRWWPLPVLGRRTSSAPSTSDREQRFVAIPVTTDRYPTVIGRTQTMLSPVKAITAGALVFAIGGLFLVAQPFDQQGSVPGAEQGVELAPPVEVTITVSDGTPGEDTEVCTGNAPAIRSRSGSGSDQWSASDPRLSGMVTEWATEYFWPVGGYIEAYTTEIVNDRGAWVGARRAVVADGGFGATDMHTLIGEGEYEGLAAVVAWDQDGDDDTLRAAVIEGGLPPFPQPAE